MATVSHSPPVSNASSASVSRVSSLRTQPSPPPISPSTSASPHPSQRSRSSSASSASVRPNSTQATVLPFTGQTQVPVAASVNGPSNPAQQPKPITRTSTSKAFSRWNDWWIWEILAGILSILTLLTICIVLAVYDGKPQPQIQWGITLNAVIAFIATIMRAAFLTLLAEGTSQLKWLAFARDTKRPLHDFNVYDAASRGGFGSVQMLWRLRRTFYRDIVTLGAVFYILSIGVDTFVQQLIQTTYYDTEINASDVTLARNQRYDSFYQATGRTGSLVPDNLDSDMLAAVYSGIYGTGTTLSQDLFSCPSGNCTYPLTPSLAVCSQCKDLKTALINSDEGFVVWTLPQGPTIDLLTLYNITSTANASHTNAFQDEGSIISAFAYINGSGTVDSTTGQNTVPDAMECVLKFCVEVYNASVVSGILEQTVVQTFNRTNPHIATNGTWPDATFDFQISTDPDLIPGPSSHSTFNVSAKALLALQSRLPSLFSGNYTTGTHGIASGGVFPTDIIQRLYFTYGTNVTALTAYLAATMTASVRRNPARSLSLFFNDPDSETALATPYSAPIYPGTAYRTVPHIRVVWWWIALPAAGVLFANIFLAVTMWMTHSVRKSSDVGVWKSSQIPLLYHGLDVKTELRMATELGGDANIHDMEEASRRLDVRLERSAGVDGGKGVLKLEM